MRGRECGVVGGEGGGGEHPGEAARTTTCLPGKGLSADKKAATLMSQYDLGDGADTVINASGAEVGIATGIAVSARRRHVCAGRDGPAGDQLPDLERVCPGGDCVG